MLRINEAAVRLGVTPTTLRRWEAEGRIHPVRTAGGERRYEEREIERLSGRPARQPGKRQRALTRDDEVPEAARATEPVDDPAADEYPHWENPPVRTPWDDKVDEAQAGLRVRRIELERAALDREAKEADERRRQHARDATRVAEEQQERTQASAAEQQRLDGLRQFGDMLAAMAHAPAEYRAKVTRDLTSYVTAAQFPMSVVAQAHEYIRARVERVLKPWREEEDEANRQVIEDREKATRQRQRNELIQAGLSHAEIATLRWDNADRDEAARDVEEALRDEVDDDWTRDDVVELVDEILDEFED